MSLGIGAQPLLDAQLAHAQRRRSRRAPRQVKVDVLCFVDGALIEIDGEEVAITPLPEPLTLPPGEHTIRVSKRGYADFYESFTVSRKDISIEADILALSGILVIESSPTSVQVLVDGSLVGETPFDGDVDGGDRTLRLHLPGYHDHEQLLRVIAGQRYKLNIAMEPLPPPPEPFYTTWWFWTGVGVAVLGTVVTTAVFLSEDETPQGPQYPQVVLPLRW